MKTAPAPVPASRPSFTPFINILDLVGTILGVAIIVGLMLGLFGH